MITTHILDLSAGKPASGVRITLARLDGATHTPVGGGVTDADGRLKDMVPKGHKVDAGVFVLTFETGVYFSARGVEAFHPRIVVVVEITDPALHHHVPLLVSPFGYTTYRGS